MNTITQNIIFTLIVGLSLTPTTLFAQEKQSKQTMLISVVDKNSISKNQTKAEPKTNNSVVDDSLSLRFQSRETLSKLIDLPKNLDISGFADLNYFVESNKSSKIEYGQFEIDLSAKITDRLSFEAALALDENSFVPGAGYLDYHFSGVPEAHGTRGDFFTHSGIHLGQFDAPFGTFYQKLPSTERDISSIPIVVMKSLNALNSFGLNAYTNISFFNTNLFVLNGFDGGFILGGRTAINVDQILEFGFSALHNFDANIATSNMIYGADLQINSLYFELNGEIISSKNVFEGELVVDNTNHWGFYLTNKFLTSRLINYPLDLYFRFGGWESNQHHLDAFNNIYHFDTTINYKLTDQFSVKLEYRSIHYSQEPPVNVYGFQIITSF